MRTRLSCRFIVVGSRDEQELCEYVAGGAGGAAISVAGSTTVIETLSLIGASSLFVGNNSGPLHLAAALKVPTVSFSGGINLVRWGPCGDPERNRVMMPFPDCAAAQCSGCPEKGSSCLDHVSVQAVVNTAAEMLDRCGKKTARESVLPEEQEGDADDQA